MKKLKLVLILTITLSVVFFSKAQLVIAWSSPQNKTAFSMGTDFKGGILDLKEPNTTEDAKYAHNIYSSMGWKSVLITEPTSINVLNKHSNGYFYFESSIVFLSGHGAPSGMSWNYKKKGGRYSVVIVPNETKSYTFSDGSIRIGLGVFNASQNDLVVYAGCETAKGSDNMTKSIVSQGANAAIGWAVSIEDGSHRNWLKRFNDKLKEKKTIKVAAEYADSFNYQDNGVKNYVIYGNKNFILGSNYEIAKSIDFDGKNEYVINKNIIGNNSKISENKIKYNIEKIIKENIDSNFNAADYKVEINGTDKQIYDYVLYVNGARTDLGYTVRMEDDKIISIFDNTNGLDIEIIKENADKKVIQNAIATRTASSLLNKTIVAAKQEYEEFDIKLVDNTIFLDTKENKLYEIISIKITDQFGYHSIVNYYEAIN